MSLVIRSWDSPGEFLSRATPFLERREAENNLLLGVPAQHRERPHVEAAVWLTCEEDGAIVGAALQTPPHQPVLSVMSAAAARAVCDDFLDRGRAPDGVFGPAAVAEAFALRWRERTSGRDDIQTPMHLYTCGEIVAPPPLMSAPRNPQPGDREQVADRLIEFHSSVGSPAPEDPLAVAARYIARGDLWVIDDGAQVVACAGIVRRTRRVAVIGLVYTVPEFRGRGFAAACTAAASRRQLEFGMEHCALFADRRNASANHVYQRLGYRCVCDFDWRRLTPAER